MNSITVKKMCVIAVHSQIVAECSY